MRFLLFLTVFLTDGAEKQIGQSRMAVHNKLAVSVCAPRIGILLDENGFRPFLIAGGKPCVPVFLLDGIGKDIQCPVQSECVYNLCCCLIVELIVVIMLPDCRFNGFLAGNVGSVGCPVLLQLPMLLSVTCRVGIRLHQCQIV